MGRLIRKGSPARAVQAVIENAVGFAETMTQKFRHPESPPVACQEGCYWCCYQAVPVSAPEAFRITRYLLHDVADDLRAELVDKLRKLDFETHGATPSTRAKFRLPCAFLRDGRCMVYSVRPLACAEFTSYNVEDCKRGQRFGFTSQSVIHEKARMVVFNAVQRGLFEGLRTALPSADNEILELSAAVLAAIASPDGAKEWLQGSDLFANAHPAAEPGV